MRDGPAASVLASAADWGCRVTSWLGSTVLAADIPATGRVTWSANKSIIEGISLRVPRFSTEGGRTVDWLPTSPTSPLARFGQQLDVTIIAGGVEGRVARLLVTDWADRGGYIDVTGEGVLRLAADDRLPSPLAPRDDGTLKSEILRLLPGQVQAQFDDALVDRECPSAMQWDEDRLAALYEIADAWPARLRTDEWGQVRFLPALPDDAVPILTLTDGEGGTVVSAPPMDTRSQSYNRVVARSSKSGVVAQAVAEVTFGPMNVNGPNGPVTRFFPSPLLETDEQCFSAAQKILTDALRPSRTLRVEMAPDSRVELDDAVAIITDKGTRRQSRSWGYVIGVDMPLTVKDGSMWLDVGVF